MMLMQRELADGKSVWFANRGQIIQIALALPAAVLAAISGWSQLRSNQYFSVGTVLFYLLIGLVIFQFGRLVVAIKYSRKAPPNQQTERARIDLREVMRAGVLFSRAGEAEFLRDKLEEVWHSYDKEKHQSDSPLIYPLSAKTLPDEIKEWSHKQLFEFRILYRSHIGAVRSGEPTFRSAVMDDIYPSNTTYLVLMRNLVEHKTALDKLAKSILKTIPEKTN